MKNFWKSLGKATVYFLVYLLTQAVISGVYSTIMTTRIMMEMGPEAAADVELLTAKVMEAVMTKAVDMTLLSGILALAIYAVVFLIRKKNFFEETSIRSIMPSGMIGIALAAVGFNIVTSLLLPVIPFPESWMAAYQQKSGIILEGNMFITVICTVILAPVLEEIVFRGLVYTRLKQGMPAIAAAIITSVLFGIVHGSLVWGIYTFLLSMVLIWTFERFCSLTANILFHFFYNLTGLALGSINGMPEDVMWVMFAAAVIAFAAGMYLIYRKTAAVEEKETA